MSQSNTEFWFLSIVVAAHSRHKKRWVMYSNRFYAPCMSELFFFCFPYYSYTFYFTFRDRLAVLKALASTVQAVSAWFILSPFLPLIKYMYSAEQMNVLQWSSCSEHSKTSANSICIYLSVPDFVLLYFKDIKWL